MVVVLLYRRQERDMCCAGVDRRHILEPGRRVTSIHVVPQAALYSLPRGLRPGVEN